MPAKFQCAVSNVKNLYIEENIHTCHRGRQRKCFDLYNTERILFPLKFRISAFPKGAKSNMVMHCQFYLLS